MPTRLIIAVLLLAFLPAPSLAQRATPIVSGLSKPVDFAPDPLTDTRFYIVEQTGSIRIVENGELLPDPFLTINKQNFTDRAWEQGLLGLAFDPDYAANKRFYVNYTNRRGDTHIARFTASSPHTADPATEEILLTIDQPYDNHNGGCLRFGSDGMLYIGLGDGGSANDPHGNAQRLDTLLGKMLRIDVTSAPDAGKPYAIPKDNPFTGPDAPPNALPEIWAYGLRNPWKFEFDSSGRLWIADVGQNTFEEIDLQPAGSKGGENYGWNIMEGPEPFAPGFRLGLGRRNKNQDKKQDTAGAGGLVPPLWSYRQTPASITGGYFYEGTKVRPLRNRYLFADFMNGRTWALTMKNDREARGVTDYTATFAPAFEPDGPALAISSFGRDNHGELYILDHKNGRLLKIEP